MTSFELSFATPRKLPKAKDLRGKVVVVDIAFASESGQGSSFAKTTKPFIDALGPRLRGWIDHHDSEHHADFAGDPRFVLTTKAEHGACPEIITPELVERIGPVDSIVCHIDFDGLASAAKWMRGGVEPYPGCDDDARAIDTCVGKPGPLASRIDRALRARPRDAALFGVIVRHLASGLSDPSLWVEIDRAGAEYAAVEAETRRLAERYEVTPELAWVDATERRAAFDKTMLLLLGQERAKMSLVLDRDTATLAAPFDSGYNFLKTLDLSSGMPTRVSFLRDRLRSALERLGVDAEAVEKACARST
jgi:hypothetical protein